VLAAAFLPAPALAQPAADIVIENNVDMKTRDGVTLKADFYRPVGDGSFPLLLQRTPYNKDDSAGFARKAAARGFMVVIQDVRGRYSSEGEWYTFKHEIDDGYDTVEWAAALPHSNGKVGLFGGSYVGATVMLAAIRHPPHLAGICPVVTASNYHENWTYQGGAFEQWFDESWTAGLAQDTAESGDPRGHQCADWRPRVAVERIPGLQYQAHHWRIAVDARTCAIFSRLARASHVRQLLETVVDRRKLPERPGSRAHDCGLVRPVPGRLAAQLPRAQGACRKQAARDGQNLII
jgi:predicted acyl esterase